MKHIGKRKRICALLFLLAALFTASLATSAASPVKLNKTKVTLQKGKTSTLKLSGTKKKVTWKSSKSSVASVNKNGKVTAKKKGTAVITAKAGGKKYTCKVTVKQPVTSIRLNQKNIAISIGRTYTLKATVGPENANNKAVSWSSSNKAVVTVNSKGTLKAVSSGTATITAKAKDGSGKKAVCKIMVKRPAAGTDQNKPQVFPTGETVLARKLLHTLQKYSDRVKSDKEAGRLWSYSNNSKLTTSTWSAAAKNAETKGIAYTNCALTVCWGLRELGVIESSNFWGQEGGGIVYRGNVKKELQKHCEIIPVYKTPKQLLAEGNLLPGDICTWVDYQHTNVYAGDGLWYDSGRSGAVGGYSGGKFIFNSFGPAATVNMSGTTVGHIIRLVK